MTTTTRPVPPTRPRPGMDPRMRQRRIEVARAHGRRRLSIVLGALAAAALVGGAFGALHTSLFAVRHVRVVGARHTSVAAVVAASRLVSVPLVEVDGARAAAAVERLPWVRTAMIATSWPDDAVVTVRERVPVARVGAAPDAVLVDATGRVLGPAPGTSRLPLAAVPVRAGPPGSTLAAADLPGLAVAAAVPPAIAGRVLGITVASSGTVSLRLVGGVVVDLGPASELAAKFDSLASVLHGAPPSGPALVDVSVPDAPTVGPPPVPRHQGGP